MKTKNYELYFDFYCWWYDWALPLRINPEYLSRDYAEIQLQILCFQICFTRISHEHGRHLDEFFKTRIEKEKL